jgi:polygalacturonase
MDTSRNIEWSGIYVTNSPSFNIVPNDVENVYMHDFEIYTDIWGILDIFNLFGSKLDTEFVNVAGINIEFPIFPLNTDAVDFTGRNGTFRNIKITNFDDVIVPKPARKGNKYGDCTSDVLVENCEVYFSTGMAIGSVPPNPNHNCINGVTYRNIEFHYPFKAIYIKTNPIHEKFHGNESGEIANIVYENIKINYPIWWGIYIGPQQQHQPGG